METGHSRSEYGFGPFRYDASQRLLFRGSEVVPLEPKIVDTLEALLERRGEVVEKAELMRRVWPDCQVEESGLSRNISLLRKALGDEAGHYVETVPKRGYRFVAVAEVRAEPEAGTRARRLWASAAALALAAGFVYWQFYRPSQFLGGGSGAVVAVLPPECLTPELERAGFAASFAAALVPELARAKGIRLISPSTVHRYRSVGVPTPLMTRVLGVQVVVEGTAQVAGGRLRVSLRMSDVHSGRLIWAEAFEAATGDPVGESEIARAAAGQIALSLGARF